MITSARDRFLKVCQSLLPDLEKQFGNNPRRQAVQSLVFHLASKFDSTASNATDIGPTTAPLLAFRFDRDERTHSDAITPEILGALVEKFAVDKAGMGAYYTPPILVGHICLIALETALGVSRKTLTDTSQDQKRNLIARLDALRIIDPACGCGAFLVGMIHELADWRSQLEAPLSCRENPTGAICGVDLDELAVAVARLRVALAWRAVNGTNATGSIPGDIVPGDGLTAHDTLPDKSFDIVVTNPPFGVTANPAVRDRFFDRKLDGPQSRDAYALFVARTLELLRPGGTAGLLISDTWRTIHRHRPLRKRLATKTTVESVIDLPNWLFPATVNTGILTFTNKPPSVNHHISAGDLRAIATGKWDELQSQLATPAQHSYPQAQISRYDDVSFFIASPKLHRILTDPHYTTLGEMATVRQGLATGDNKKYLRKRSSAHGNYVLVNQSEILTDTQLRSLTIDEKVSGVDRAKYGGRKFVPYDKGGASRACEGWLPNYYVPTGYFIDWSKSAVAQMKTTTSERQRGKIAARFQNSDQYFKRGITFSYTGFYSPCFRLSSGGVFDVGGSSCFDLQLPLYPTLALLGSKLMKYLARNYINHTVNFQVDDFKALPLPRELDPAISNQLKALITQIVTKQKLEPSYPYHRHEQIEIDRLVYVIFGLTGEDIREVEGWYDLKYSKLAARGSSVNLKCECL